MRINLHKFFEPHTLDTNRRWLFEHGFNRKYKEGEEYFTKTFYVKKHPVAKIDICTDKGKWQIVMNTWLPFKPQDVWLSHKFTCVENCVIEVLPELNNHIAVANEVLK